MQVLRTCPECGLLYLDGYAQDVREHNRKHAKYLKACDAFGGRILSYTEREKSKQEAYSVMRGSERSLPEKRDAAVRWFWAYFSRSVEASEYNLKHPPFEKFVAMLLNRDDWRERLDKDVSDLLVKEYGQLPGIAEGSYYIMDTSRTKT